MDSEGYRPKASGPSGVGAWLKQLDRILRGDATRISELRGGKIEMPLGGLIVVLVVLGMIYGACMGCFSLMAETHAHPMQVVASMVKVPALYFLTLLVTLPSLYVFNALVGSRLTPSSVVRLLIASLAVMLAVLASLGPIVAFFSASTTSYPFMIVLNVVVCGVSGILGLLFLIQTLHRLSRAQAMPPEPPASRGAETPNDSVTFELDVPASALEHVDDKPLSRHVKTVFRIWLVVFGLVGAQMSWVLRPFIGSPTLPFAWFRPRQSNFFEAVFHALLNVFN